METVTNLTVKNDSNARSVVFCSILCTALLEMGNLKRPLDVFIEGGKVFFFF